MSPVFTRVVPDPIGQMLGTRMNKFESACGVDGLMRENGHGQLELLAVAARNPGRGDFRNFITLLKYDYATICVWFIDNQFLGEALKRYGFKPEVIVDEHGDKMDGLRWDKPKANIKP